MSSLARSQSPTLAERLGDLVGSERVTDGTGIALHGLRDLPQARPADVQQLAAVLALADSERLAACIAGGATRLGWGLRPDPLDLLLDTQDLRLPFSVDPDNLTMTVGAGVTVGEARTKARLHDRVLPLDVCRPDRATVGGVVATGDQGPRGAGYGRVRDLVLGLKATLADGTSVSFGGRTVKNVAGYDMAKLFVGSFGSFGVITEVTFRLVPRPDTQGLLAVSLSSLAQAKALTARILDSCLQPLVLEVLSPPLAAYLRTAFPSLLAESFGGPLLLAGFAGHPAALARSLVDVSGWSSNPHGVILRDTEAENVFDALTDLTAVTSASIAHAPHAREPGSQEAARDGTSLTARVSVPISEVWSLAQEAESLATEAHLPLTYQIGAACGTLDLRVGSPDLPEQDLRSLATWVADLRTAAVGSGGRLVVTGGLGLPGEGLDVWGDPRPDIRLVRSIKEKFDPHRTLNPGMNIGGI